MLIFLILFYLVFGEVTTFLFALVAGIIIWFINWQTDWELNRYKREFDKESINKFKKNHIFFAIRGNNIDGNRIALSLIDHLK